MVYDASEVRRPPRWRWTLHRPAVLPAAFLALTSVTVDELPRPVAPCEAASNLAIISTTYPYNVTLVR
jgi:hypothetical protein